jgi:hypothetical protein
MLFVGFRSSKVLKDSVIEHQEQAQEQASPQAPVPLETCRE